MNCETLAAWRVVYMVGNPVECSTRNEARQLARQSTGKVQGYIPAVGWIDDSRIPEASRVELAESESGNRFAT